MLRQVVALLIGENGADRVVPSTGVAARLTLLTSGCMAFLAIFAMSLALSAGRLADAWSGTLNNTATVRLIDDGGDLEGRIATLQRTLQTTPGIAAVRIVSAEEQRDLLRPWLGSDLPVDLLPLPGMVEITLAGDGPDIDALNLRLQAEVPGAVWDDHEQWRRPLVVSARQLWLVTWISVGLITAVFAAMIVLAAQAALAANTQVVATLRLVGATDTYVARAFVRRFTLRAAIGAFCGTLLAVMVLLVLPGAADQSFLPTLRLSGVEWLLVILVPVAAIGVAFLATRISVLGKLRRLT